ncbi:MAG TPA: DNA translocase FtsK 4TM domain-containing protein [Nitriliruptorales bacterium]|nr:DNA translocase FtsK 4TM domain-containing protein [Nitriliruptorales bacterium]
MGDQRDDVHGVGLILLGVITGLGMYAGRAGAVGAALDAVIRGLIGVVGYALPMLLVYAGVLLVADRPVEERGRRAIGLVLLLATAVAGWHLARGLPEPADGYRALWPAGGLLGWALARPLQLALGSWGTSVVLAAGFLLGALIFTKTPVRRVWAALAQGVVAARRWLRASPAIADVQPQPAARPPSTSRPVTDDTVTQVVERAVLALEEARSVSDGIAAQPRAPARDPGPAEPDAGAPAAQRKAAQLVPPTEDWDSYRLPPLDLLRSGRAASQATVQRHVDAQARALQATFEQFGVDATVARTSRGPTVTRFEVELGPGVQVRKVVSLGDDVAYALAAPDVRIVAPIPGKSAIGVEVPNRQRDLITLRDILDTDEAQRDPHPLRVALGVDIAGHPALVNLATMPHLLISGATGAGKSVTLNSMISSVILRARPDRVRMILIDPKRVELNHYQGAPHLLSPVITDPKRAAASLEWVVKEMEQRYETLALLAHRNIDTYNEAVAAGTAPRPVTALADDDPERPAGYRHLPYILVVIDELADLMLVAPRDVEEAICRIAQMARAVGIHLLIATQRPSVDVITGLIKANIPSRLALAVASQTDSRTILDQNGAEKLVGHGDMLFLPSSQGKPSRLQGCLVSEQEIEAIVTFCKQQRRAEYVQGIQQGGAADPDDVDLAQVSADDDDELLLLKAMDLVVRSGLGSTSMLQRKLRVGFARAGRLMDELEQRGVVGRSEGSRARDVLMTVEELDDLQARPLP